MGNKHKQIRQQLKLVSQSAPKRSQDEKFDPAKLTTDPIHLYMSWDPMLDKDQMYKIRKKLQDKGAAWIAKISITPNKEPIREEIIQKIKSQITSQDGVETRLYMTNFKSVHVYNIVDIQRHPPLDEKSLIADTYEKIVEKCEIWFKVNDVYVLSVDDPENVHNEVSTALSQLEVVTIDEPLNAFGTDKMITPYISSLRYPVPVRSKANESYFRIISAIAKEKTTERWHSTHRCVTREYKVCGYYLEKNMYAGLWDSFCAPTQHYLIECEMKRIESCYYNSKQSYIILRQAWECYILAVVSQLYQNVFVSTSSDLKRHLTVKGGAFIQDFCIAQYFDFMSTLDLTAIRNQYKDDVAFISMLEDFKCRGKLSAQLSGLRELRNRIYHRLPIPLCVDDDTPQEIIDQIVERLRSHLQTSMLPIPSSNTFFLLEEVLTRSELKFSYSMKTGNTMQGLINYIDELLAQAQKRKMQA